MLTRVTPFQRASFCIKTYKYGSKRFIFQSLVFILSIFLTLVLTDYITICYADIY